MSVRPRRADHLDLSPDYRSFHDAVRAFVPEERVFTDPLRVLAYGTDASFYRLTPKVVVKARSRDEVARILALASARGLPVTFRAAGTSLSGQAVSDSILVVLAGGFRGRRVLDGGARVALEPGVIGGEANQLLAPLGRKLGPDPASIHSCMVGGIAANNASGMCCGTAQNSYRTVDSAVLLLADGTELDTADPASRRAFAEAHPEIVRGLAELRDAIRKDPQLLALIRRKYAVKNTTGYGLNSFVDFDDPFDVLLHLLIGSEGTLAFLAEITYRTVEEQAHRASALVLFPDIGSACEATTLLKQDGQVSAVELMDRASIRSVEAKAGMPPGLAGLGPGAAALLVEVRGADAAELAEKARRATTLLAGVARVGEVAFTSVKAEFERLWDVRRGLFPAVGAARRVGTTVVIEDVVFPIERLAEGTLSLQALMRRHGYDEGIIFGHALDGNLHFVFTQDFATAAEVERYRAFMDEVCRMVALDFGGSLKGEHGTGRNIAPFVELEWGARAYGIMKAVKALFDPRGLLNPGVILNADPQAHLRSLKPLPKAHDVVDRCIECGFCEVKCPSRELTTTPRQRIAVLREISRLEATGDDEARRLRLLEDYRYDADETCATDGLCATACPVSIDTGEMIKSLRAARHAAGGGAAAVLAHHLAGATAAGRATLSLAAAGQVVLGDRLMGGVTRALRSASGGRLPQWNPALPGRSSRVRRAAPRAADRQVVYFPSCVVRTMGPARADPDQRSLHEATRSLLEKAGYEAVYPKGLDALCCGMAFDSKGYPALGAEKLSELGRALEEASRGGELPVLCDTSPCLHRMRKGLAGLTLLEPVELIHDHLLPRLELTRSREKVAVHVTCSAQKMGLAEKLVAVARACAAEVVVPPGVGCCAFAGDRGLSHPELNASALAQLRPGLPPDVRAGYSNSRTCEIGLTLHAGIPYQSIVYLVDRCARPRAAR
ncbi:FAD-binding and (Fe-S)-binding domain-containing protein [Anaeromyxobacter paludicola]|uniref:D-lactate dehydrogenase (cytochrome) n=1 Tax=Anaeromyxobacter paludicola TaxID=2918171 RepID=A0ABM7X5F4_9BACT|nr:FAD-binding and (Fe-S)-binding domain-containing protein [Anaeromyxobacter paludicola]BDG07049.1 4Fe-4S ferredoxin [Anaeromyxobacter paludicola]